MRRLSKSLARREEVGRDCSICMDAVSTSSTVMRLPCSHAFQYPPSQSAPLACHGVLASLRLLLRCRGRQSPSLSQHCLRGAMAANQHLLPRLSQDRDGVMRPTPLRARARKCTAPMYSVIYCSLNGMVSMLNHLGADCAHKRTALPSCPAPTSS